MIITPAIAAVALAVFLASSHLPRQGAAGDPQPSPAARSQGLTPREAARSGASGDVTSTFDVRLARRSSETLGAAPESLTAAYPGQTELPASWHNFGRSAKSITVAPYPDLPMTFERTSVKDEGRYVTWFGTVKEIPGSSLVAVATPGGGWHSVMVVPGSSQFNFDTNAAGETIVSEAQPGEEGCAVSGGLPDRTTAQAPTTAATFKALYSSTTASYSTYMGSPDDVAQGTPKADTAATQIGVLFVYRADLLTPLSGVSSIYWADSVDTIDGRSKAYIEQANVVLANSSVTNFQFKYLGLVQTPSFAVADDKELAYVLDQLSATGTVGDWVAGQAYKYGASQVFMWMDQGPKGFHYSGVANTGGKGVAVTTARSARAIGLWASSYKTMLHELAHNFGCQHDRANAGAVAGGNTGAAPEGDGFYSYGVLWTMPDPNFPGTNITESTIMGYGSGVIPYFSNPNIVLHVNSALANANYSAMDFGTVPIGYAITDPKAAYNAKVLTDNATKIAAFGEAIAAPSITTQPQSTSVTSGSSFSVSVTAAGGGLSYQWSKDGNAIAGATASTYSKTASSSDAGSYTVTVSNMAGTVTSSSATLTVTAVTNPPPSSGGGGGGGGGGAPSHWFLASIAVLTLLRFRRPRALST